MMIWPTSPIPADLQRMINWNYSGIDYDSGAYQGSTPFARPLYSYNFPMRNFPRSKQSSLHNFVNLHKLGVTPFLFQDPYDNRVNSTVCADSGFSGTSFYIYTQNSYQVIPQSGTILITSALSGTLPNSWFSLNQDTGIIVRSGAKATADVWTASCAYYKKCVFTEYDERSFLWEQFNGTVGFKEIV